MNAATSWGVTAAERAEAYGCDSAIAGADGFYWRGVTVDAPPEIIWRWLCQLRAAPYSYDWIDNFGRRSPQHLTPGLDTLAVGQRMMTIFRLTDFVPNREMTLVASGGFLRPLTGSGAITYRITPAATAPARCRLVAKLAMAYPRGPIGWFNKLWLPWGDLIMIRRQLLNFKGLAERDYAATPVTAP